MLRQKHILIISIIMIIIFIGCQSEAVQMHRTINYVWDYAKENPEGFTLNIKTYKAVTEGIAVSYLETQDSFGKESLASVITHALKHESIVGGWLNDSNRLYYFDSNKIFPDTALHQAINFAIKNRQSAIYDMSHDSLIWISDSLR